MFWVPTHNTWQEADQQPTKLESSSQGSQVGTGSWRRQGGSHAGLGFGQWAGPLRISYWFHLRDLWKASALEDPILKPSASSTSPPHLPPSTYGPISAHSLSPLGYTHHLQASLPVHYFSPTYFEFFQTYRKAERKQPTLICPSHRFIHCWYFGHICFRYIFLKNCDPFENKLETSWLWGQNNGPQTDSLLNPKNLWIYWVPQWRGRRLAGGI